MDCERSATRWSTWRRPPTVCRLRSCPVPSRSVSRHTRRPKSQASIHLPRAFARW